MKKTLTRLSLALLLTVALAGCSSTKGDAGNPGIAPAPSSAPGDGDAIA